ncbi:MAG: LON peptidase substrate-binding domain-containing protein [Xanthomonadales bacterium]|nr:LON peptidase substrate-binding domain-containing protein [Xanthomonadales bacterium]
MVDLIDLPLFPLRMVLFPGGSLALRIFEPRYLDLVRDSARDGSEFGICLILDGEETGAPAIPAAVGTMARISDFDTLPEGLLGITVEGRGRFRARSTRVRDNGLVTASVEPWPEEPHLPVPPEHGLLATILERLVEQVGGRYAKARRECFDDASWVGFRLAELLPLAPAEKQHLLETTDPLLRLAQLAHYLPRFQDG